MNYRHIYHAGNFADVAKHVALLYCLDALKRKPAGFFALDTHAGRGFYDLQAAEAHRSGEAERGIQRVIERAAASPGLAHYLAAINARPGKRLARYPGSPMLIAASLRPQDRAILIEQLPAEARALMRDLSSAGRIRAEIGDGYAGLKAFLPPEERRGLVIVDPPYEGLEEFKMLVDAFFEAYRRWSGGTYLLWYPIRSAAQRSRVHARFESLGIPKILAADLAVHPDDVGLGLAGSGLIVVNPPFGTDEFLRAAYAEIHGAVASAGAGYVDVSRLTPERFTR